MMQRVECRRCRSHRDLATTPRCMVCGSEGFQRVPLDAVAMAAIDAEVIAAAEALDASLDRTYLNVVPGAKRLREACRVRAAALGDRRTA